MADSEIYAASAAGAGTGAGSMPGADAHTATTATQAGLHTVGGSVHIGDFHTEAGGLLNDVTIAYCEWGNPNGPVVLVEHALTGDADATQWWPGLIGSGLAIDTDSYRVICTNALGSCYGSTGPSSPHPEGGHWGSRFPALNIRDMVNAEKAALEALGIDHVYAIIGGSMGGARTLEWTLLHPDFVDMALVMAVSARASAWQIGIQSAQITAIRTDPYFKAGDYYDTPNTPIEGLAAARRIAHLTYRGELELDERFGADSQPGENALGEFIEPDQRFAVNSYLEYQAHKLTERFDAATYVVLTEALNRHNVGLHRGGLNKALAQSTVPTMVVGVDTDILYPYHQQEHLVRNLGNTIGMAKIVSPNGHDAFLTEQRQLDRIVRRFFTLGAQAIN